jgi:short-subunit dehydrogenase
MSEVPVVLITGASAGIGECLAYEYSKLGASLVLAARSEEKLLAVAAKCRLLGAAKVLVKPTDVSKEEDCFALIAFVISSLRRLSVLVLNAGVACHQPFEETDLKVFRQLMDVNYFGYVYCTKAAIKHLRASKGSIVVVGSVSGELGLPLRTAYCASKFAVTGLFEALRAEVGDDIRITVAQPGFVKTNIRENSLGPKDLVHNESESHRMSPQLAAKLIVDAAQAGKRKVFLTFSGRLGSVLKPMFPSLVGAIANRRTFATPAAKL